MQVASDENVNNMDKTVNKKIVKPDTSYFGPVYPEAPKFQNPEDDLLDIGVTRTAGLKRIQLQRNRHRWKEVKS
jgi:hypothetical protein